MDEGLARKTGRGAMWNISAQIVLQLIRFCVIFVLARLLTPKDFGLFAMVLVFTELIGPLRELGFQVALIYKKDIDEEYRSTAFWSIFIAGIIVYLLSLFFAASIGKFFNNSEVTKIIPVVSIGFLFAPLGMIQWAMLMRNLQFKVIAARNIVAEIFYGVTTCILAFNDFGVWSLVIGSLVRELSLSLTLWFFYKWRPFFIFHSAKFREILNYGIHCTGIYIVNIIIGNIDNLLVGKFMGPVKLGFYNLAFNTVSHPQTKLVSQVSNVTFPVFSAIQDDKERIKNAYKKTLKATMMITVPILAILFVSAKEFVLVFYGNKWLATVALIQAMCFYGLIKTIISPTDSVFLSQGRADMFFRISILKLAVFSIALLYGIRHDVIGVAIAIMIYSVIIAIPILYYANKIISINNFNFYIAIFQYIAVYFFAAGSIWLCDKLVLQYCHLMPLPRLFLKTITGLGSYFIVLIIFFRSDLHFMFDLIKKIFK